MTDPVMLTLIYGGIELLNQLLASSSINPEDRAAVLARLLELKAKADVETDQVLATLDDIANQ